MSRLTKFILKTFLIVLIIPYSVHCQQKDMNDAANEKLILAAREIIDAAGTCALITLDDKFIPMVRTMDPFPPEADFTVWFGTNAQSRKVSHIKNNPDVTLYYRSADASGYVVIHGKAKLVDDQKEKEKRWKEEWEAFYPNNREGYILIKVSSEWMEILSYAHGIVGDPETWETPIVRFD